MARFCIIAVGMLITNMYVYTMDPQAEMDLETEKYHLEAELKSNVKRIFNQFPNDDEQRLKISLRNGRIGHLLMEKSRLNKTRKQEFMDEVARNFNLLYFHNPVTTQETAQLADRNSQISERISELNTQISDAYATDPEREILHLTKERDINRMRLQLAGRDPKREKRGPISVMNYNIECALNMSGINQMQRKELLDEMKRNHDRYEAYFPITPEEKNQLVERNNQISHRIEELEAVQNLMRIRNDALANQP